MKSRFIVIAAIFICSCKSVSDKKEIDEDAQSFIKSDSLIVTDNSIEVEAPVDYFLIAQQQNIVKDTLSKRFTNPLYSININYYRFAIKDLDKKVDSLVNRKKDGFLGDIKAYEETGEEEALTKKPGMLEGRMNITLINNDVISFELEENVDLPLGKLYPLHLIIPYVYDIKKSEFIMPKDFLFISDPFKKLVSVKFKEYLSDMDSTDINSAISFFWEDKFNNILLSNEELQLVFFIDGSYKLRIPYGEIIEYVNPEYKYLFTKATETE